MTGLASRAGDPSQRGNLDGQLLQSRAHTLERRRLHGLDLLEAGERRLEAGARNDGNAIAIAHHHVAGGDRNAAADDRQPTEPGPRLCGELGVTPIA